jgi:hypothetical protein
VEALYWPLPTPILTHIKAWGAETPSDIFGVTLDPKYNRSCTKACKHLICEPVHLQIKAAVPLNSPLIPGTNSASRIVLRLDRECNRWLSAVVWGVAERDVWDDTIDEQEVIPAFDLNRA